MLGTEKADAQCVNDFGDAAIALSIFRILLVLLSQDICLIIFDSSSS